jgi:hypothetical protein
MGDYLLYWNCRAFAEGKRKERCPYEHLGLRSPTCDWWESLHMSPEELEQKLSSPQLAACDGAFDPTR